MVLRREFGGIGDFIVFLSHLTGGRIGGRFLAGGMTMRTNTTGGREGANRPNRVPGGGVVPRDDKKHRKDQEVKKHEAEVVAKTKDSLRSSRVGNVAVRGLYRQIVDMQEQRARDRKIESE